MFKSRRKKAEEEAKLEEDYRPTEELEADEEKVEYSFPRVPLIVAGVLVLAVIICLIVIFTLKK